MLPKPIHDIIKRASNRNCQYEMLSNQNNIVSKCYCIRLVALVRASFVEYNVFSIFSVLCCCPAYMWKCQVEVEVDCVSILLLLLTYFQRCVQLHHISYVIVHATIFIIKIYIYGRYCKRIQFLLWLLYMSVVTNVYLNTISRHFYFDCLIFGI